MLHGDAACLNRKFSQPALQSCQVLQLPMLIFVDEHFELVIIFLLLVKAFITKSCLGSLPKSYTVLLTLSSENEDPNNAD